MGFKDWFNKGKKAAAENSGAVKDGIEKTADFADEKTDQKFSGHIDTGADAAKDAVDRMKDE